MANEMTTADALKSLKPGAQWVLRGGTVVEWTDGVQTEPTALELSNEVTRFQGVYDNNAYQRTRANAYPELKEQLDLLYHDMAADKGDKTGTWFAAVKAVKDATAKPS